MSKISAWLLAGLAVMLVALPAAAVDDKDFQLNGMLRTRFDHFEDYDFNSTVDDNYNFWAYRAMVGVTGNFTDNISAHVDLQAYGDFGDGGFTSYSSPGGANGIGGGTSVDMYQAFVALKELGGTRWDLSVGRRELTFGKELQFGDNDFYNGQTFDGMLVHGNFERWDLGFGFLQINESQPAANPSDDDQWIFGSKANFKLGAAGNIEPYVIYWRDGNDGNAASLTPRRDLTTFGALWMHHGEDSPWDASAEYAMQTGETGTGPVATDTLDNGGWIFEGEFGWTLGDHHRIHVNYLTVSGDDDATDTNNDAYQPLFPDLHAHNRLGDTDIFSLTNIEDISAGYTGSFGEDKHHIMFSVHQLTVNDTLAADDDLGTEIDLSYDMKYSDNTMLEAGVATLSAGDALGASVDDPFRLWAGIKVAWGPEEAKE